MNKTASVDDPDHPSPRNTLSDGAITESDGLPWRKTRPSALTTAELCWRLRVLHRKTYTTLYTNLSSPLEAN
jgi:hypothetical protein